MLLALGLVVLPPLPFLVAEGVAGLIDPRLRRVLHLSFVALLAGVIVLQALKRTGASSAVVIPASLLVGAGLAFLYTRAQAVRSFLSVLAPAPIVFCALFLFFSPITPLLSRDDAQALARVESATPVVVVVFDEFALTSLLRPNGRIDAVRYPNFARLASGSYWFRNAGTVHELTEFAVPALLTGERPSRATLPIVSDHPRNLFTLLGGTHAIDAEEPITNLCPREVCPADPPPLPERMRTLLSDMRVVTPHELLPADLREHLPSVTASWQGFAPSGAPGAGDLVAARNFGREATEAIDARTASFERFLRRIRPERRPTLDFLHVLLPHAPLQYLPSGRSYGSADLSRWLFLERWADDRPVVERAYQRYLLQVQHVDRMIGRLVARLRATGLYDRALVVLTADHGVSFQPGESRREPTQATAADIAPVPLLIKAPGQRRGEVVPTHVSSLDLLPTMADLLDLRLPWKVDGRSAFAPGADRRWEVIYTRHGRKLSYAWSWLEQQRAAAQLRQSGLFGWGAQRPGLYGVGPHPELVGRRPPGEVRRGNARARVTGRTPHVTGWIDGDPRPRDLAIALDGTIRAVTTTYDTDGRATFDAMVPEPALRGDAARLEVLEVRGGGGDLRLESLGG